MEPTYKCSSCGAKADVKNGVVERDCTGHEVEGVTLDMGAVALHGAAAMGNR